jgi:hypothetical protein
VRTGPVLHDAVGAGTTAQLVLARTADQSVGAGAAVELVVTAVAVDRVVAGLAVDQVAGRRPRIVSLPEPPYAISFNRVLLVTLSPRS